VRDTPLQSWVTPFGEPVVAVNSRGLFMGNRGCLRDGRDEVQRFASRMAWITCALEYNGERLPLIGPGKNTQLFFLDEATALAAGHRPCARCRRHDFNRFREAWGLAHDVQAPRAPEIDEVLDGERGNPHECRWAFYSELEFMPDGTMVDFEGHPHLVHNRQLVQWTAEGYANRIEFPERPVSVLTPFSAVVTIAAGYEPVVHPSAEMAVAPDGPDTRPVQARDIDLQPMRAPAALTPPDDVWVPGELAALSLGYSAGNMDEKWSACMEGWTLRVVRSWTGLEMFRAEFEPLDGPPTMFIGDMAFSEAVGRPPARIRRLWAEPNEFGLDDERSRSEASKLFVSVLRSCILG